MANYNLSLPAETIDSLLLWLDDKQDVIIKQTDLLSGTGQSTTATMTQKAITDALGTKADADNVYTKTQADTLLNGKVDKEAGKGLSSNDYTNEEKAKLAGLPTGAELDADLTAVEQEVAQIAGEAGLAEAVIDTDGAGTEQEFTFRKSGGDGGAYYRKIKGKTIVVDDQLASNDAEAVETTGVNQWDEELEAGGINRTTGQNIVVSSQSRSKNYIPVFPDTSYYCNAVAYFCGYDAEKNFVWDNPSGNNSFTTPANVKYVRFFQYTSSLPENICINLSNPAINGQYFPYWKRTLQLDITTREDTDGNVPFADGMKGAGTASDWCDKKGGEKRMGRVDLGSNLFNWMADTGGGRLGVFFAINPIPAKGVDGYSVANIICSKYVAAAVQTEVDAAGHDMTIGIKLVHDGIQLFIQNNSLDGKTSQQVKDALSGVMLDYELATPVPFTWAEPLNLGVKVDENGTERAVAPEGATAPSAPFVADTTYTMSVARMVEILKNL